MLRSGGRTSISVSGRMNDRPYSTSLMLLTSANVIIKFEYTMDDYSKKLGEMFGGLDYYS